MGFWMYFCFLMNSTIGSGILALPQAFQRAGVIPCFITVVLVAIWMWALGRMLLSVTEKLTKAKNPLLEELADSNQQWDLPEIVRKLCGRK